MTTLRLSRPLSSVTLAVCLITMCLATPLTALAEWSFEAYVGGVFMPDGEANTQAMRSDLETDTTYLIGGRLGYWLGVFPYLGVALDASYLTSELSAQDAVEDADLNRVPLSGLVMLRLPVWRSSAIPQGRVQPYVAAGPTLVVSQLDTTDVDATSEDVGLDARAGLNLRLTGTVGLFAEYRLTYVDQTFTFDRDGVRSVLDTDPSTHHLIGGISLRF